MSDFAQEHLGYTAQRMLRPLALAWRFLLVVSLALNPLVGLRTALAADGDHGAGAPCQMSAAQMAAMPGMSMRAGADASGTSACPSDPGCKSPGCAFAACCGPCLVSLSGSVASVALHQPPVRLPGVVARATADPAPESLIRPPIA